MLAIFDTLAVPIVCGSGDTGITSNYSFKPIRIQVFAKSEETENLVKFYEAKYGHLQRRLEDFKVKGIRAERELRQDPSFASEFVNFPIRTRRIPVPLSEEEYKALQQLKECGFGQSNGEALRMAFFKWYHRNHRPITLGGRVRLS